MPINIQDLQPFIDNRNTPSNPLPLGGYSPSQYLAMTGGVTRNANGQIDFSNRGNGGSNGSLFGTNLTNRNPSQTFTPIDPLSNSLGRTTSGMFGPGTSLFDPAGLGSLLSGLFGNNGPSWKPYAQDGLFYGSDPSKNNPVPITNVPGASLAPGNIYRRAAGQIKTIQDLLPYLTNAINAQQLPTELTNLQTSQITSPAYAQLMTDLYNNYGPQLNAIGNEIQNRNAMAQAQTEQDVINGPGKGLVNSAYDLSQKFDKPWYDSRDAAAGRLQDLLKSIDLSGKLSGSENNEIEQSLARQGVQRGTQNAPSASDTVANAMTFGKAGYARKQQATSNLSDAISKASAFLPSAKSGVDVFQVATGRSSMPNPGNSLFPGISSPSNNNAFGLAGSLLGTTNSQINNQMQINSQKKDWLDQFNQLSSGIGNLVGAAGKGASLFGM